MGSTGEVKVTADVDCNCCSCCCGGMGFIRQAAEGSGTVFLNAGGTVVQKVLFSLIYHSPYISGTSA